jgi:hypothetical protein
LRAVALRAVAQHRPVSQLPPHTFKDDLHVFFRQHFILLVVEEKIPKIVVVLCQEGARAPCCTRDEGGPFGAVL